MAFSFSEDTQRDLSILNRRRTLVIGVVGACLLLATTVSLATRPLFRASAFVVASPMKSEILPGRELARQGPELFSAAHRVLAIEGLAEAAVQKLGLQDVPEFQADRSTWRRLRMFFRGPVPAPPRAGAAVAEAAAVFRSRTTVEPVPESFLFAIHFTSADPQLAARAANTLAELYLEHVRQSGDEKSDRLGQWLSDRLAEQRKASEEATRALVDSGAGPMSHDQRERLVGQRLEALGVNLARAHADRIAKQIRYEQVRPLPPAELATVSLVTADGMVQAARARLMQLRQEYGSRADTLGDRHPEMAQLRVEMAEVERELAQAAEGVRRSLAQDYRIAVGEESALTAAIAGLEDEARELKREGVPFDGLQREARADQDLYQTLISRVRESGLQGEMRPDVRIEQRAIAPRAPFYPDWSGNHVRALVIGLLLSLGLVFLLEGLDRSLRTPEDVKRHLGLPLLGVVPAVAPSARTRGGPIILGDPGSSLAEAYRFAGVSLSTGLGAGPPERRIIVVSSMNPGEGKSVTATNLAASLAQNDNKVLLVDADLRRPRIHRLAGVPMRPGLSDLVSGACPPSEAIRATRYAGVHVLPTGRPVPNPAEILGSPRMRDLLISLAEGFRWVLVDTPPLSAVADALTLCRLADGVVLVVAAEATSHVMIQRGLEQVTSVGGRPIGVVLNKVDLRRNAHYYRQYYPQHYSRYGAEADVAGRKSA